MQPSPIRICADCGASAPTTPWDDETDLCAPCYDARDLEIDQANAVAIAHEIVRYHGYILDRAVRP